MLFFFVALTLALAVSFALYLWATQTMVNEQNPIMANMWAQQHLMEGHWDEFGNVQPAGAGGDLTPDAGRRMIPADDSMKTDFRRRMEDIAKRIRQREARITFIAAPEKIAEIYNFGVDAAKKESREKKNRQYRDTYKTEFDQFPVYAADFKPETPAKYIDRSDEAGTYHYFEEVRMNQRSECILCHSKFLDGELMGVVHVEIPKSSMRRTLQKYLAYMLAAAIVSIFLALVAVNVVIRYLVIKPLRKLRSVAESISRGEVTTRAELRTGDEFESLAGAFNRMLAHLGSTQDQLRRANMELESKVNELAHQTVRLYETNRIKSDFMATMSHELRTPLNSILGFSDVLGSISALNEKQKKYVENINTSGKSLLTMINDILDMAKMEAGRMGIQPAVFNIASIVSAQADMAKPLADRKNIALELSVEPNLPPMKQDESRLQQILNNLLSNAIKFTPEGGRITVLIRQLPAVPLPAPDVPPPIAGAARIQPPSRDLLELTVSDTGVGISEEDLQIIFEKFRQGASAMSDGDPMKRKHSGSGLGLSIVREICKMLEGEITVQSQLGTGSVFTVRLPWILEPRPYTGSDMSADIQQFAQHRVNEHRNSMPEQQ
jgi:signal transduction histidine kinase